MVGSILKSYIWTECFNTRRGDCNSWGRIVPPVVCWDSWSIISHRDPFRALGFPVCCLKITMCFAPVLQPIQKASHTPQMPHKLRSLVQVCSPLSNKSGPSRELLTLWSFWFWSWFTSPVNAGSAVQCFLPWDSMKKEVLLIGFFFHFHFHKET